MTIRKMCRYLFCRDMKTTAKKLAAFERERGLVRRAFALPLSPSQNALAQNPKNTEVAKTKTPAAPSKPPGHKSPPPPPPIYPKKQR